MRAIASIFNFQSSLLLCLPVEEVGRPFWLLMTAILHLIRNREGSSVRLRGKFVQPEESAPIRVQCGKERSNLGRPELPIRGVLWELPTGASRDERPVQVEEGDLDSARGGCDGGRAAGLGWLCGGSRRRSFLALCGQRQRRRQVEEVSEVRVVQQRGSEGRPGEGKEKRRTRRRVSICPDSDDPLNATTSDLRTGLDPERFRLGCFGLLARRGKKRVRCEWGRKGREQRSV